MTVLVVIVAVFLAYNANNGLPFVSTYNLKALVPNADALVKNNEIRIGGVRVGIVRGVKPVQLGDGRLAAELDLRFDKNVEPLPDNSTIMIRPKSALGLKYLQVTPGDSKEGFEPDETIPLSAARPEPIDIDEFFDMFNEPTREAIKRNQAGFGTALAGRGPGLNEAFGVLRDLVVHAQPAVRVIAAPSSDFDGFWRALEALSATVAPVAEQQASMFVALDETFAAFARVSRPYIQETIVKGPPTLDLANENLPVFRPFLRSSERFFTALKPGAKALAETSPTIAAALRAGVPVLNASPVFNNQLVPTAEALLAFQQSPGVFNGLNLLIDTNNTLGPAVRFIAPSQTFCNYATIAIRNLSNASEESNGLGNWLNVISFEPPAPGEPNAESGPSSAPASGPGKNHLHYNPYPNTAAPGQPAERCEAGNERFVAGKTVIGEAPVYKGGKITFGQQNGEDE
ncbi:MAG TPA: MlaD family protein [Solirubrobacterales bacterium]|nr:MlaD family protein [Solirubrobacterales bacterium]